MSSTDTWLGGNGNFDDAQEWSDGVPGAKSDVVVPSGFPQVTASFSINWFDNKSRTYITFTDAGTSTVAHKSINSGTLILNTSNLSIAAPLTNNGRGVIQVTANSGTATLSVASLTNTGSIQLFGAQGELAELDISGTAELLGGSVQLAGDSLIELAGMDQITTINQLEITGSDAFVAAAGIDAKSNSALKGLTRVDYSLALNSGAQISTSGPLTLSAGATITLDPTTPDDPFVKPGSGSALNIGTAFTVEGTVGIDGGDTLSAGSLVNRDVITLTGTSAGEAVLAVSGQIANNGVIDLFSDSETLAGPVTGKGSFNMQDGSSLQFDASAAVGETVTFDHAGSYGPLDGLVLGSPTTFHATISGFAESDTIDIGPFGSATTLRYTPNSGCNGGQLRIENGATEAYLTFDGDYAASDFFLWTASDGDTMIGYRSNPNDDGWVGGTGSWADAQNWDSGLPTSSSDAIVPQGDAQVSAPIAVNSLEIGSSGTVSFSNAGVGSVAGSVSVEQYSEEDFGALEVGSGSNLEIGGTLTSSGMIEIGGSNLSAAATISAAALVIGDPDIVNKP